MWLQHNGENYASFRVGAMFNSTTTTQVRDEMHKAVGVNSAAKLCKGGYNITMYNNVAALFAEYGFTVSQNSECTTV
jgi:hypothetical protein